MKLYRPLFLLSGLIFAAFGLSFLMAPPVAAGEWCGPEDEERGIETSFDYGCPEDTDRTAGNVEQSPVYHLLLFVVDLLAIGVGIAVVGAIVWGGIKYASSSGSPESTKEGIKWITNALTGLLLFLAMYALINFVVPGGLFN